MNWIRKKSDQTLSSCNHFLSGHRKTKRHTLKVQRDSSVLARWGFGRSICVPSLWPSVEFQGRRHTWIQFVVGSHLCSKRFFSGYPGFPLCSKTIISKSLIRSGSGMVNEFDPLSECATPTSLYTHYKLICKPHGLLSTFLNPIQTGLFLRFLWPWRGSLEVPLVFQKSRLSD